MNDIAPTGKKRSNKNKGIAAEARARRRQEAEDRHAIYLKKPLKEKLKNAGSRERARLERNQNADQ